MALATKQTWVVILLSLVGLWPSLRTHSAVIQGDSVYSIWVILCSFFIRSSCGRLDAMTSATMERPSSILLMDFTFATLRMRALVSLAPTPFGIRSLTTLISGRKGVMDAVRASKPTPVLADMEMGRVPRSLFTD